MQRKIDSEFKNQFLKDMKLIKSILMKYEHMFSVEESETSDPRFIDILLPEERGKIDELKLELSHAWSDRERNLILKEVDLIFEKAQNRYYQNLKGEKTCSN